MKVKYFDDTDTALLELTPNEVVETREINPNTYFDLDAEGELVSITIEHARQRALMPEVIVERFGKGVA